MIRVVVFDWNGTLSDDMRVIWWCDSRLVEQSTGKRLSFVEWRKRYFLPFLEFYRSLGVRGGKSEIFAKFNRLLDECPFRPKRRPGSLGLLQWLKRRGVRAAVLSSLNEKALLEMVRGFGFGALIYLVMGGVNDKRRGLEAILDSLGLKPAEAIYVGDTAYDIETAKGVGMVAVGVSFGYQPVERLRAAGPACIIKGFGELKEVVKDLNGW